MAIAIDTQRGPRFGSVDSAFRGGYVQPARVQPVPVQVTVLTRRGRFVLGLAIVLALVAGAILLGSTGAATQDASSLPSVSVTVQPGDTLWGIASEANPGGDIRQTITDISQLNALERGTSLPVGVTLSVPVYE